MKTVSTSFLVLGLLAAAGWGDTATAADAKDKGADKKPKKRFTVSTETTYATKPIDKDGYIDYATALNERLSKGVTPANNANVLIWKALGPHPEGATMPPEFFKWLGVPQPPEKGDYFIDLGRYARESLKIEPGKVTEIFEQQGRATQKPWKASDYPAIASWLKANEKPLAVAIQATRRSHYFNPLTPRRTEKGSQGLIAALLPAVQKCRELATALTGRAMLRLAQGDSEGAWQDLLACHRLGRLVGRGGTLIEALVGIAIDSIASRGDLVWLDRAKPDAKRIEKCLDELRKLPPLAPVAEKVDLAERFLLLETVQMVDRHGIRYLEGLANGGGKPVNPFVDKALKDVQWDPALRNMNRWYDHLVAAMRVKDRAEREKKLEQIDKELRELKVKVTDPANLANLLPGGKTTAATRGKLIGDILIALMMPAVRKVQQADDRGRQIQDNLTVAFALAWYQRDHGRYPEKLEALAPKYLAKVPSDRFSGKALIYRPADKGYLLYSVGVNGKDEGGRSFGDMPPGDDLPVRMPQPEPRK
jgi:hypothetical protein